MKFFYIDDSDEHEIIMAEVCNELKNRLVARVKDIEYRYVKPKGTEADFLFFGENGHKQNSISPSELSQIERYSKLMGELQIGELLNNPMGEETFFLLDINFGQSMRELDRYGIHLAKFLLEKGVKKDNIFLLTNFQQSTLDFEASGNSSWQRVFSKEWYFSDPDKIGSGIKAFAGELETILRPYINEFERVDPSVLDLTSYEGIIGGSKSMRQIYEIIENVAESDANILILGESGTGKEVIANALRNKSKRSNKPFVKVNCSALPKDLIESQLFGHIKGSFTGANADKIGFIGQTNGGSLLLDEIGEMPIDLQPKLLRVLQEKIYYRVGSDKPQEVDFRLICSTNRNPFEAIHEGLLREDLYYRINTIEIKIPPLRERMEDIPMLAEYFLQIYGEKYNQKDAEFSRSAYDQMLNYNWRGNVRELQHVIERAVLLSKQGKIEKLDIPKNQERSALRSDTTPAYILGDATSLSDQNGSTPIQITDPEKECRTLQKQFKALTRHTVSKAIRELLDGSDHDELIWNYYSNVLRVACCYNDKISNRDHNIQVNVKLLQDLMPDRLDNEITERWFSYLLINLSPEEFKKIKINKRENLKNWGSLEKDRLAKVIKDYVSEKCHIN